MVVFHFPSINRNCIFDLFTYTYDLILLSSIRSVTFVWYPNSLLTLNGPHSSESRSPLNSDTIWCCSASQQQWFQCTCWETIPHPCHLSSTVYPDGRGAFTWVASLFWKRLPRDAAASPLVSSPVHPTIQTFLEFGNFSMQALLPLPSAAVRQDGTIRIDHTARACLLGYVSPVLRHLLRQRNMHGKDWYDFFSPGCSSRC